MSPSGIDIIAHIKFVQSDQLMIYLFSFQHVVVVKFHRNNRLMGQYRACVIDFLGRASYITVLCVQAIMILTSLLFRAIPIFPF